MTANTRRAQEELAGREQVAVRSLKRLAGRWPETLGLFAWSGTLMVIRLRDGNWPLDARGAMDQGQIVATISGITTDGGDPC